MTDYHWRYIARQSLDEIREAFITGYKSGKPYHADSYQLLRDDATSCRILDFGCGIGRNFSSLLYHAQTLMGYDLPEMIEACQKYSSHSDVRLSSDWKEVRKERFDLIVSALVFQHLSQDSISYYLEEFSKISPFLYINGRAWCDNPGYPNILREILDSGHFEYLTGSTDIESALSISYPDEIHIDFVVCSKYYEQIRIEPEHLFEHAGTSYQNWFSLIDTPSRDLDKTEYTYSGSTNDTYASSASIPEELLDDYVYRLNSSSQEELHEIAVKDDRKLLREKQFCLTKKIYDSYSKIFGPDRLPLKENLNTRNILIIGDYHESQCVRYRIDQKIQQLEKQGTNVTTIDWRKIRQYQNLVVQHDVVFFYRVPAVPEIIKAMAMINANGKASFYEIDDLLFDDCYPPELDSYGGFLDSSTHIELRKSMASFYAAARHCRFGIASTLPLRDKLTKLVFDRECLLHRNGLDDLVSLSPFKSNGKATVDIFYGSGTKAHNSDFIEEALPALKRLLKVHANTRLIVAGHLQLPDDFLSEYKGQLVQLPLMKDTDAYWAFLSRADINLAVLKDDVFNGCKSEVKWLEASCFRTPTILSSTQNIRDILVDGEDALIARDEKEWLSALERLVMSQSVRKKIAKTAYDKAHANYSIDRLGKSLLSQLDQVLGYPRKTTKKKVAIVNVFFPPQSYGGATRVVSDNFDSLRERYADQFDLVVFTSDKNKRKPYLLSAYQHHGVTVYKASVNLDIYSDWKPKDENMRVMFKRFLEIEEPDLIHFHCVQRLSGSIVQAAREAVVPYIVTLHDAWWISDYLFLVDENDNVYPDAHPDLYAEKKLPQGINLEESVGRLMYLKELLLGAKALLAVSESFADIYRKNGFPETRVNKNGLSSMIEWRPKDTRYTDKVVCGHIGGKVSHKGYFLLKEAIENKQPENIELLIVDISKDSEYEFMEFWGDVPVTFIGYVDQSDVVALYRKMDVLFAPSTWPESYGLVTRESAACGCWVVASDLGGIGEDIVEGKTGFKIKPELGAVEDVLAVIDSDVEKFKGLSSVMNMRRSDEQVDELMELYGE